MRSALLNTAVRRAARPVVSMPAWWYVAALVAISAPLTLYWWNLIIAGSGAFDWRIFVEAGHRFWVHAPNLYEAGDVYSFRHSPVFAMLMPAVAWIGVLGVRIVIAGAAIAMPTWPMRLLTLASWPLVMDVQNGALVTVLVCVAAWALRGARWASIAFIVLALLSPRPLMVPIAMYLLWAQPWLRVPALVIFVVHGIAVLATGYAADWASMLLGVGTDGTDSVFNLSPSRVLGSWWFPVGIALAAFLTLRGRVGLAALAVSPYVLPHYLLFGLLELDGDSRSKEGRTSTGDSQTPSGWDRGTVWNSDLTGHRCGTIHRPRYASTRMHRSPLSLATADALKQDHQEVLRKPVRTGGQAGPSHPLSKHENDGCNKRNGGPSGAKPDGPPECEAYSGVRV